MGKIKTISILLSLIFLGNIALASDVYLPKADLIKGTGPEVYILENGVKRWIPDPETFEYRRYKWTNIKTISDADLAAYPQGDDLDKGDDYPEGTLLRGSGPEVYLIELGKRRWFPNPEIFEGNDYGWKYIYDIDDEKLEAITRGDDITLSEPNRYPETMVLDGPDEGEVLENTEVTFKYSGTDPLGEAGYLSFETYLVGHDTRWHNQYSNYTETYNLSSETKVYTFYVRAKNEEGYADPSPASLSFQIGVSSYYQEIQISQVYPNEQDFEDDYLVLRNGSDPRTINITDWTIKTKRETITIPQAAKKLTYPFSESSQVDIDLAEGDEVIISTGLAPNGVNFRVNKCTGYLDQLSQYYPSLDEDCPYLDDSEYSHLKKDCRDFIDDLSRCEIPDYSDNYEVSSDSQCTTFLTEKFNYSQCYQDYEKEADFLEDEWRVFLGKSIDILDNDGDTIILRDKDGLVVDEYSY
ncbi:MAG: hypothetical protein ISS88_00575 [Candidatus Portnoybacteria bacterium]|nr:hypothetical protein [Candidatus Portnoybacteria bacterium]